MGASSPVRMALSTLMNVVIFVAVVLTVRVIVGFFGVLSATQAGTALLSATGILVPDFGIAAIRTPYGGVLDAEAAIMVVLLLLLEWMLAVVRSRA